MEKLQTNKFSLATSLKFFEDIDDAFKPLQGEVGEVVKRKLKTVMENVK